MRAAWTEFAEAWRGMTRRPRLLLQGVATLAVGVAASTLLFSLVAGTLLSPPRVPDVDRVLALHRPGDVEADLGQPDVADLRAGVPQFAAVGLLWDGYAFDTVFGDRPVRLQGAVVDRGYFDAVALPPLLGRVFGAAEDGPAAGRAVVLSERLWRSRYGADPAIVGRVLTLNAEPFEVIGVAREDHDVLRRGIELWAPAAVAGDWVYTERGASVFDAVARLAPGADVAAANAALDAVMGRLAQAYPRTNAHKALVGTPAQAFANQSAAGLLWTLQAATLVLLAVAVVNVMSMLLVRGAARSQELGLRGALGARRGRLLRVALYEGGLLGLGGALAGVALAFAGRDLVLAFAREALPRHAEAALDLRVLGFAAACAVLAGLCAAALPALRGGRVAASASRATPARGVTRLLQGLMAAEIALACALAIGALLLLRTLTALGDVPLGFRAEGVLSAELVLPDARYRDVASQSRAVQQTLEAMRREPGIAEAAFVVGPPLRGGCCIGHTVVIDGRDADSQPRGGVRVRPVLGDYFGALGIPLGEGRAFDAGDDRDAPRVAILNRRLAEQWFPGESPLGKRIAWRPGDVTPAELGPHWMEVVGVVEDVRAGSLREGDAPAVYFPYVQRDQDWVRFGTLVARTRGPAMAQADALQRALASVDPLIPLQDVRSLEQRAADAVAPERFAAGLAGGFGTLALLLALQGVAAVLMFAVALRRAELGVRAALGADSARLLSLVLGQGLRPVLFGVVAGLALAALAMRGVEHLLFGVAALDPASYVLVGAALLCCAALAAWWPARLAARTAPALALRHD